DRHPLMAADIAESLRTLVPHGMSGQDTPFSASHHEAFGSVVLSHASDTTGFAEVLIHELQHSKLGVVLTLVDLLDFSEAETAPLLYAPWRDDPRPAIGVLHGVASFMAATAFYREHRPRTPASAAGRRADFEFAYPREQPRLGTAVLSAADNLPA